ncbi:MAG TPA: MazG family protein [Acidimicrobiales bacterium]|nr:MazG family protein [Acidimicrobiales bacterium]
MVVVGLGPAGPELWTAATVAAVERVAVRFVRTARHPSAADLGPATSCDDLYERSSSLEQVYGGIVERLVAAAAEHHEVLYAVPGSPRVAEAGVDRLCRDRRVEVEVVPALSFLDLVWERLGVDPLATGVRLVDGRRFAVEAAGERGPLVVAQCDARAVLSEVKLAVEEPPASVVVLQRLGSPDEAITEVAWADLDRDVEADHLTSLWIPALASPVGAELVGLADVVRTLRDRCPWDREQTHATLTRYLLEETYELLEAIDELDTAAEGDALDDAYEHLEEELGDVLFQVLFHATLAAEAGRFDVAGVARGIHDKLVRRHPHVFAGLEVDGTDEIARNWERIKAEEKGRAAPMASIPANLPALLYAHKIQRRAGSLGIDASVTFPQPVDDLSTPVAVGEALFSVVAAAGRHGIDPEAALRVVAARFRDRVAAGEDVGAGPT